MPPDTIYVGRPTKWGNPIKIGEWINGRKMSRLDVVRWYREHITPDSQIGQDAKKELRGKNLACWCCLQDPCHADVLLEIANS